MNHSNSHDDDPWSKYDPNVIIQSAEEKFKSNDISGAQMVFMSALLDWVDDAREGVVGMDPDQLREAIATLWLSYANLNKRAKLFKSAMEAYEQAVSCPVAGSVGRVWLEYARFGEEREKVRTAQKIFLRALMGHAVKDEQDRSLLWQEFLEMMRRHSNPNLTMVELKEAAEQEHSKSSAGDVTPDPIPSGILTTTLLLPAEDEELWARPEKRQRIEPTIPTKTFVVTAEAVESEAADLLLSMHPEVSAAWFVRDGDDPPGFPDPLFSASPPKLADPTGKDILGEDLALAVITKLLKKDETDASGTIILEVCRGCWMLTALKEKEAAKAILKLDDSMMSEMETMETSLEARLSVAGAAASAVQQMNQNERNSFQQSCFERRQELLTSIAWGFRQVLATQQQILTKLQIPAFHGPTVDGSALDVQRRVCSYLHSAFYLRTRIGEAPHHSMLKSQADRLTRELLSKSPPNIPPPPTNLPPPPPPPSNLPPPPSVYPPNMMYNAFPPQQQQQMQQPPQYPTYPPQYQTMPPPPLYGQPPQPPYYH